MVTLQQRPYRDGDADAVADLLNLIDRHGGGHGGFTGPDTHAFVTALVADVAADTSVRLAPDGAMIAAELTVSPPVGGHRVDLLGGVLPEWRGQGIGREILARQLARAEALHAASGATADWEAHASVMVDDEDALRLFRRFSLEPLRYWFEMAADNSRPVSAALPDSLRAQSYRAEWDDAMYAAHSEAFQDHWGHQQRARPEWFALTVRSENFLPELSRVAFDGDEVAGYVLCYRDADPARLYVGHVGTRRPWRRRGVAGGLLAEVILAARDRGFASTSLGVDADSATGAVGVYERVGFTVESRAVTYSRSLTATA